MAGKRILIVDDNPVNQKLLRVTLAGLEHELWTASDAEAALALLADARPDLILLDIQLPGMDGLALTRRLKRDPAMRGVRIVAVTAYASPDDEERAMAAGCDGFIAKPIDTRTFPHIVERLLGDEGAAA